MVDGKVRAINKGGRVFPILLLAFIFVPIIEIGLFIQVGSLLGMWPTIALVLITAFVGASLVRSQGIQTLLSVQHRLQQGELPAQQIVEGVILVVAGVLLLVPGFLTDALGMVALLPAPRALLANYLMNKVVVNSASHFQTEFRAGRHSHGSFSQTPFSSSEAGETLEGEFERKEGERNKLN
ncbi:membrane protein FxsA [Vibrio anguillarum]|nr:membrane protein FxsA [Vibrio anguillarum]MBF4276783.1 membrane protein FxsA [Vibrio anguillarum]MBF4297433.1 membrane protein FxsA [Vibrio anguillarum]MBF4361130.1 membrane protein FxsA [Vibrio anguillarum]MBF4397017.1 membrane protein FxsA [Vibrio anguillarum]